MSPLIEHLVPINMHSAGEHCSASQIVGDPGSVFLYRRAPRELAEGDCSKMTAIVYSVSFSNSADYFLASRVQTHNKDVIFRRQRPRRRNHDIRRVPQHANQRTDQRYRTRQLNSDKSNPVPHSEPDRGDTNCFDDHNSSCAACHYSLTGL